MKKITNVKFIELCKNLKDGEKIELDLHCPANYLIDNKTELEPLLTESEYILVENKNSYIAYME